MPGRLDLGLLEQQVDLGQLGRDLSGIGPQLLADLAGRDGRLR
jgi:hypothetical protein